MKFGFSCCRFTNEANIKYTDTEEHRKTSNTSVKDGTPIETTDKISKTRSEKPKKNSKKVLLLGNSAAGKTTVLKQMKLKWRPTGLETERQKYIVAIRENLIGSIKRIIYHMDNTLKIQMEKDENKELSHRFKEIEDSTDFIQKHYQFLLKSIPSWLSDSGFKEAIARGNEYNLFDSAKYFLHNHERIIADSYVPTNEDILRARNTTLREEIITFENVDNDCDIIIYDMGGRKGQRNKWMHYFDNVDAILFVASLSCYDQLLEEDQKTNQMDDTFALFKTVIDNPELADIPIIIFLNKIDLFEEKLAVRPLSQFDKSYLTEVQQHMDKRKGSSSASWPVDMSAVSVDASEEVRNGITYYARKFKTIQSRKIHDLKLSRDLTEKMVAANKKSNKNKNKKEESGEEVDGKVEESKKEKTGSTANVKFQLKQIEKEITALRHRKFHVYVTHATDQNQMTAFISKVKDAILSKRINEMFHTSLV